MAAISETHLIAKLKFGSKYIYGGVAFVINLCLLYILYIIAFQM